MARSGKIGLARCSFLGYNKLKYIKGEFRQTKMKGLKNLIWLTQLGLSVAVPPIGFIWLAVWLHKSHDWGVWVIFAGIFLGLYSAVEGFRATVKTMAQLEKHSKEEKEDPPVSFNEHG